MSWGTPGAQVDLEGASGRTWKLRFERRLAPRDSASITNPASSVWLVRDEPSSRLYAAKRQSLASLPEVDALVDEAAAWRAACLADELAHIVELVDVFVMRSSPFSVTFLAEYCARGLLPRRDLSEPVLLTIAVDVSAAAMAIPSPHAHIAYESLLVDAKGRIRLAGFGAHRSAILRDNPGLTPSDDAFDIGLLLYELIFSHAPPDDLSIPPTTSYSSRLIGLVEMALSHPQPSQLHDAALNAGAEPRAPVIDIAKPRDSPTSENAPIHVARATERSVERLVEGVDIGPTFNALLSDLEADPQAVSISIFKALFKKPVSKDPLCAVRAFTMLHNLMLDGPEGVLAAVRKNDKFLEWAESSWSTDAVKGKKEGEDAHPALQCFAAGELAFYAALLRRKARFHQLAAGGFSGRWDRTGATNADGRDVLETRRRKVISGIADIVEMASELGCLFAAAADEEAPSKHASLGAMVSECCLAYNASLELAHEVLTVRDAEKLVPAIGRLYAAARTLVFAVEHVPTAGGEPWVEQFAQENPPDLVADVEFKGRMMQGHGDPEEFPREGWEDVMAGENGQDLGEEKKDKKKKKRDKNAVEGNLDEASPREGEVKEEEITAADGALVVHGEDEASKAVTAMFGDLLRIDDDVAEKRDEDVKEVRPMPDMSNAQALASAFGVPEDAIAATYEETLPDDYGDDDDEGGYEDYQARQEDQRAVRKREARGPSTAAWAARAGYGTRALVVSEAANVKKSHPAFCQCAICQQEEAQAAAAQSEALREAENFDTDRNDISYGNQMSYGTAEQMYYQEEHRRENYSSAYVAGENDSLDDEDEARETWKGQNERTARSTTKYYEDDYDSYESVTYDVEDDRRDDGAASHTTGAAIAVGPVPRDNSNHESYIPVQEKFKLESSRVLNLKKLRTGDKISEADTVVVHKGDYNREVVAIKKLTKKGMQSDAAIGEFTNEIQVMCSFSHENLLKCIAASIKKPNFIFVTEFMKRGTLFEVLYKSRIRLTWALIKKMALQLAQGMCHIHERGYVHRDLKTLNIFTDAAYNVKIGDFGLTCRVTEAQSDGISGTYQYMAPEVLKGEQYSFKSDVFSYAVVLCEMVSGVQPYKGLDPRAVAERVVQENLRPTIPMSCQRGYADLIKKCWATVPLTRPSFAQIVDIITLMK